MTVVRTAGEVFEAIQKVKAGAAAFCTNFFPVQSKLENWIAHRELSLRSSEGVTFFLRKDRDFAHLYFCGANPGAFGRELPHLLPMSPDKLSTDFVGPEASLIDLLKLTEQAGFSRYARLVRLTRAASAATPPAEEQISAGIRLASQQDARPILELIERHFDRFADQLPALYDIESAVAAGQIFAINQDGEIAALLFFETQGLTSTIRYWLVAEQFHSRGMGSALIRHYFSTQSAVRRFILWVTATNDNAMRKYRYYGYAPDGLIDPWSDSGDYQRVLDQCVAEFDWADRSSLDGTLVNGRYHGLGVGCFVEGGGTGPPDREARCSFAGRPRSRWIWRRARAGRSSGRSRPPNGGNCWRRNIRNGHK